MAARDREVLSGVIGEGAVWHVPPSAMPEYRGPHSGREAILALVTGAGGLFVEGSQRVDIHHIIAEGELAAALFRQKARTTGGRDYDNLYTFFFRVRNGQIQELWENVDTGYFFGLFEIDPTWVREGEFRGHDM